MRNTPGGTLEEKASFMKMIYEILREYFGDKIVKTFYITANNRFNEKCVMIIQEKVDGIVWGDIHESHKFYEKALGQVKEIEEIVKRAGDDPRIEKIRNELIENHKRACLSSLSFGDILYEKNMIVDKDSNVKIIDW